MTAAVAVSVLLLVAAADAQPRASFTAQPGRVAAIVLPASLLDNRDVKRQLGSGLTTTFLIVARDQQRSDSGSARMEVRFDLWDEVWLVRRVGIDGAEERQRITTREALDKWWSTPIPILHAAAGEVALTATLTVLPFSVAEGEDARQWIAKSGGVTGANVDAPFVTALIGTTISAKPIRSYRWSAKLVLR